MLEPRPIQVLAILFHHLHKLDELKDPLDGPRIPICASDRSDDVDSSRDRTRVAFHRNVYFPYVAYDGPSNKR